MWCLVSARAGQRSSRTGDYGTRSRSRHARGGTRARRARAGRDFSAFVWLRRVRFVYVDRCTYFSDTRTSRSTRTHVEDPRERRARPRDPTRGAHPTRCKSPRDRPTARPVLIAHCRHLRARIALHKSRPSCGSRLLPAAATLPPASNVRERPSPSAQLLTCPADARLATAPLASAAPCTPSAPSARVHLPVRP